MKTLTNTINTHLLVLRATLASWLPPAQRDERGSASTDFALWAVAVVVLAGIVILAINAFVTGELAKLG